MWARAHNEVNTTNPVLYDYNAQILILSSVPNINYK